MAFQILQPLKVLDNPFLVFTKITKIILIPVSGLVQDTFFQALYYIQNSSIFMIIELVIKSTLNLSQFYLPWPQYKITLP